MRYVIADKYDVHELKEAAWHIIELGLAVIRAGAESFLDGRAEQVTRTICEGFFLGTRTYTDTSIADSEQGIMDLLDHVSTGPDLIPDELQHHMGQELHRTLISQNYATCKVSPSVTFAYFSSNGSLLVAGTLAAALEGLVVIKPALLSSSQHR